MREASGGGGSAASVVADGVAVFLFLKVSLVLSTRSLGRSSSWTFLLLGMTFEAEVEVAVAEDPATAGSPELDEGCVGGQVVVAGMDVSSISCLVMTFLNRVFFSASLSTLSGSMPANRQRVYL